MRLLSIENITSGYGKTTILQDINLYVEKGEFVVIIGPNGAGKTSLLETVYGAIDLHKGAIHFNNENISKVNTQCLVRKGMAYMKQTKNIFPTMTVLDNLITFSLNSNSGHNLEEVYKYFPTLKERERQIAGTLSGGERQMLAIGSALMTRADLILLDEPSGGLAPKLVRDLFNAISKIHERGTSILLVEQNPKIALEKADRVYLMEGGKIKLTGNAKDFVKNDAVAKGYLGLN